MMPYTRAEALMSTRGMMTDVTSRRFLKCIFQNARDRHDGIRFGRLLKESEDLHRVAAASSFSTVVCESRAKRQLVDVGRGDWKDGDRHSAGSRAGDEY